MYTGKNNLFCIPLQRSLNIGKDARDRMATAPAARYGGDTKCAMVIATVLNLDKGASTMTKAGQALTGDRFEVKGFLLKIEKIGNELVLMIIGDHLFDGRQGNCFLRLKSNPTTGCNYLFNTRPGNMPDLAA